MDQPPLHRPLRRQARNAESDDKSLIVVKLARDRKSAYVMASRPGTLVDWILKHLDAASGYKPPPEK